MTTAAEFMAAPVASSSNGNTTWASRYAAELRQVVNEHAANAERSLQVHLGPSELGSLCDRQVAGKLAGLPSANDSIDPWASVIGTAVHAWLADAFTAYNKRHGVRWVPEQRVVPHPDHSGTADLYDAQEQAVVDHKILGESSMAKVRAEGGPPIKYQVQLLLYGKGYQNLGLPVQRVALAAYPRASASLDGLYVWERPIQPSDDLLIEEVFKVTARRKKWADAIREGRATLDDVPMNANDDECFFCPFFQPHPLVETGPRCAGTAK